MGGFDDSNGRYELELFVLPLTISGFNRFANPTDDPAEWGYEISPLNGHFIPLPAHSDVKPFRVHLFGGREEGVEIPAELEAHVLVWHGGLDYLDFYAQLAEMVGHTSSLSACVNITDSFDARCIQDLVLPILRSDEYIRVRATAAFPAGILAHVPSLVMPHQLKSYIYLEPPAIILHPDGTNEVQVVAAMRRGEDPWTAAVVEDNSASLQPEDRLLHSSLLNGNDARVTATGFAIGGTDDWDAYTTKVRTYNARMLCKALLR